MQNIFYSIVGRPTNIIDIPSTTAEVAYTSKDGNIHLIYYHQIMEKMENENHMVFRLGLFAHEMLHQIFSDFQSRSNMINMLKTKTEQKVFASISNIVEDGSIEHYGDLVMGGYLLKALKYMIAWIYKETPSLETAKNPMDQFMRAMIQFEGGGVLKGKFTFLEAKEAFMKAAPYFMEGIKERDAQERLKISAKIYEVSKSLWEKDMNLENSFEELLQELLDNGVLSLEMMDTNEMTPVSFDTIVLEDTPDGKAGKDEKREKTLLALAMDSDLSESCIPSENALPGADDSLGEDLKLDDKTKEDLMEQLEIAINAEKKDCAEKKENNIIEDVKINIPEKYKGCSEGNQNVTEGNSTEYSNIKVRMKGQINSLTTALQKIFKQIGEEKVYKTSGRISLNRIRSGKTTSRIFEKRRVPENRQDMAIFILCDESGSMSGTKIDCAKETAIALAETFGNLKIPIYIMGFTADYRGKDAYHYHYVKWNNSPQNRYALTKIKAREDNFDGYSIRYAGEKLKKRSETHKLLIVLSDGRPACYSYRNYEDGYNDTKNAIREVRKYASVLGIAIGNNDTNILFKMYGKNFIHVSNTNEMFTKISNGIKEVVKSWE